MPTYTLQELADNWKVSERTVSNRIKELKKKRVFKKTALGKSYNDVDKDRLCKLLGYTWQEKAT